MVASATLCSAATVCVGTPVTGARQPASRARSFRRCVVQVNAEQQQPNSEAPRDGRRLALARLGLSAAVSAAALAVGEQQAFAYGDPESYLVFGNRPAGTVALSPPSLCSAVFVGPT